MVIRREPPGGPQHAHHPPETYTPPFSNAHIASPQRTKPPPVGKACCGTQKLSTWGKTPDKHTTNEGHALSEVAADAPPASSADTAIQQGPRQGSEVRLPRGKLPLDSELRTFPRGQRSAPEKGWSQAKKKMHRGPKAAVPRLNFENTLIRLLRPGWRLQGPVPPRSAVAGFVAGLDQLTINDAPRLGRS